MLVTSYFNSFCDLPKTFAQYFIQHRNSWVKHGTIKQLPGFSALIWHNDLVLEILQWPARLFSATEKRWRIPPLLQPINAFLV